MRGRPRPLGKKPFSPNCTSRPVFTAARGIKRSYGPVLSDLSALHRHADPALRLGCLHQTDFQQTSPLSFPPSRAAALERWRAFAPRAGAAYAAERNHDRGPAAESTTSRLSPYLRHRALTEPELAAAAHSAHGEAAQKFIDEIAWRTYWKGWLECHPAAWRRYRDDLARLSAAALPGLATALAGRTGIDCFDAWVAELQTYNYLHNHARMWFASIWIHTLRLPWPLGAAFFEQHLLDGDPASNTLSWRWVAGLQTVGKPYLARADNIARYTDGAFSPKGLADAPLSLTEAPVALAPLPIIAPPPPGPALLLLHDDDLDGDGFFRASYGGALIIGHTDTGAAPAVSRFQQDLRADAAERAGAGLTSLRDAAPLIAQAQQFGVTRIVTPYAPLGPTADALADLKPALAAAGIALHRLIRPWDATAWPHAKKGFFAFREVIPALLRL